MAFDQVKSFIEKSFDLKIYRNSLPKGMDSFFEIKNLAKHYSIPIDTFFDVGANIGQSTVAFKEEFPSAQVYAFEPILNTVRHFKSRTKNLSSVYIHPMALGSRYEEKEISTGIRSDLFSLNEPNSSGEKQKIVINTLDEMIDEFNLSRISVLKIDTEGYDIEVLHGAAKTLECGIVDFIQVETTLLHKNGKFIHINDFTDLLKPLGYDLMSISDQEGWHIRGPFVFCNALFQKSRDWYS